MTVMTAKTLCHERERRDWRSAIIFGDLGAILRGRVVYPMTEQFPDLSILQAEASYRAFAQSKPGEAALASPGALADEIKFKRELFSKLKFQYLEQETREKFLRAVLETPPHYVDQQDIDAKAALNQQVKAQLHDLKQNQRLVAAEARALAAEVLELHRQHQGKAAHADAVLAEIDAMEAELAQLAQANPRLSEAVAVAPAQGVASLEDISRGLNATMQHENDALTRLQGEFGLRQELLDSRQRTAARLEAQLAQLERDAQHDATALAPAVTPHQVFAQWLNEMNELWAHTLALPPLTIAVESTGPHTRKIEVSGVAIDVEMAGADCRIVAVHGDVAGDIDYKGYSGLAKLIKSLR